MAVYSLTISGNNTTEFVQNVLHYDVAESGSHSPYDYALDLIAGWIGALESIWLDVCPDDYYITSYRAKKVTAPGGPMAVEVFAPGDKPGTRGPSAASGIGPVVLFPVSLAGKNVTGRIFIPGVAHADILENTFINGLPAKLALLSSSLVVTLALVSTGVNANFCIYHRATGVNAHAVVNRTSEKVGTQRKRYVPLP